jgi:GH24 family phage-related lysozyme (muramidase)
LIDNTSVSLVDSFKRFLYDYNLLFDGDKDSFEPSAISVNSSALISRLEKVVDRLGNSDGKVSASELARAQSTRWVAQAMSHLAVRYESEWGGDLSKWKSMSSLMKEREFIWRGELARIEKLRWWDKVHGVQGLPADPAVYHFHPVGVVGNFADLCPQQCKTDVYTYTTSEGDFVISTRSFELILASEGYKDHPYVPPNDQSSGVTVGYGYDLGQQSSATITNDLQGLFADATISRLTRASGVHGDAARAMAPSFGDIYVSRDAALQLAMRMKRRFAQQTVDAFPGVTRLHPHCQGALLSLIVNRGPGLQDKPHQLTRKHMRAIRKDVSSGNLQDVVAQFRDMKSLWNPAAQRGLLIRRDKEADLFEDGANCTCWR